jgi:diguanylate cyclase (GGDEF)-like protein/PAS domain S-box-containing protein
VNFLILIVTANASAAEDLRHGLAEAKDGPFRTQSALTLADALASTSTTGIDCILLDLDLPDSTGIATFDALFNAVPGIPIVVLSCKGDDTDAIEAVQRGAQGYFSQGYFRISLVPQALRSIIARKASEEALYLEQQRSRAVLEAIGEAVLVMDLKGCVSYLNPSAERLTGWASAEACGRPLLDVARIVDRDSRESAWAGMQDVIKKGKPTPSVVGLVLVGRDGHETVIELSVAPVHERTGVLSGAVIVLHDATLAEASHNRKMTFLANHDFLTELPNRLLLNDRIQQTITRASRSGTAVAVLFLDLDHFKHINDSLGHAVGDKLLQKIAQRLTTCVRSSDTVSRLGGDEFIIVIPDERHVESVSISAEKLLNQISTSLVVDGHHLHITASIGISIFPQDGTDVETLLKNADMAMYSAKNAGRGTYRYFDRDMNLRAVERQQIEAHLRHAILQDEFELHYQPRIDLESKMVVGAEALLRWRHAERGLIMPDKFVDVAEDCGLITTIGYWVFREACQQIKAWADAGLHPGSIAVNVSATEFRSDGFFERVRTTLETTRIDPNMVGLELTETVLMSDVASSQAILIKLKQLGVKLIVDDFGTGYSSLSYLRQFPIDVLKIDQSFVRELKSESDNGIIVTAVVGMGRNLRLRIVAEGVETEEQCRFLRSRCCDEGQGYYFSRPLPPDQFKQFLENSLLLPPQSN